MVSTRAVEVGKEEGGVLELEGLEDSLDLDLALKRIRLAAEQPLDVNVGGRFVGGGGRGAVCHGLQVEAEGE